jgi:hypothetical protein
MMFEDNKKQAMISIEIDKGKMFYLLLFAMNESSITNESDSGMVPKFCSHS